MKKHNFLFVGECAIVLVLLILIGILIKDEKYAIERKESVNTVVETIVETQAIGDNSEDIKENNNEHEVVSAREPVAIESTISENDISEENDKIKIVVFGDSIWNAGRGTDGISEKIMEQLDVEIYNCAIGGTTAAVNGESTQWSEWTSRSFNGMMYIATDIVSASELIPNDEAYQVIKDIDFEEIDYVIVSYGLNDYFSDIPVYPKEYYDLNSYVGALRHGVQKIHEKYPDIEFILTSPTYCEWFKGDRQYELGTYVECARSVAQEMDLHFLDMYHALGKNPKEKMEYLSDGVHLTADGRALYANSVIEYLKQLEGIS